MSGGEKLGRVRGVTVGCHVGGWGQAHLAVTDPAAVRTHLRARQGLGVQAGDGAEHTCQHELGQAEGTGGKS